ncbi:protein ZBED8-like [Stegodyphus dumicola]|uniref:protein ZBED8-like n=1 Tax=Stegodyphus dumicola TaxID=202533 RepID=UPI0015B2BFCF|nr:protein ZBED8-like [Stegodyphus dumicola]
MRREMLPIVSLKNFKMFSPARLLTWVEHKMRHRTDTGDHQSIKQHPRRLPIAKQEEVRTFLKAMEEGDVIEPSMAANRKRTYQDEFFNYGFTQIEDNGTMKPQCVVCMKVLTSESFKKSQLKKHLDNLHSHLSSKPREYFANLEISVKRQRLNSNLFGTFDQRSASRASFELAWLIARNKKPYIIGEDLAKPAAVKMAEIMCGQKEAKKLNSVPLSASIVNERISVLAENVKEQVIFALKQAKYFAIQLDETTDFSSNSQLMVYVRYKGADNFEEELLFCSPLELRSLGIDVYNKVNEYFNAQSLNWKNCISVSLDEAPAMLGHINAREIVSAFGLKLQYWRQKVEQNKIASFSRLALFLEDCENITFADIKDTIVRHLIKLRKRFSDYFPDLDTRTVSWIVDPFKCEIAMIPKEPSDLAEAILELRSNTEARIQFESKPNLSSFWMSKAAKAFKIAHEEAVKKLLPFGTTYLCEQGFSTLMNIKTKNRNGLNAEDCIQIALTSKSPNFEAIVSNMKQHHFSKT